MFSFWIKPGKVEGLGFRDKGLRSQGGEDP